MVLECIFEKICILRGQSLSLEVLTSWTRAKLILSLYLSPSLSLSNYERVTADSPVLRARTCKRTLRGGRTLAYFLYLEFYCKTPFSTPSIPSNPIFFTWLANWDREIQPAIRFSNARLFKAF